MDINFWLEAIRAQHGSVWRLVPKRLKKDNKTENRFLAHE